jgi:hypothetical protein
MNETPIAWPSSSLSSALKERFLEKYQLGRRLPLKTVGPAFST